MKSLFALLVAGVVLFSAPDALAQNKQKFGHIDSNELLQLMPEREAAEKELEAEAKALQQILAEMQAEYEQKLTAYQTSGATMSDLVRQTKEKEIIDLEARIEGVSEQAQMQLEKKRIEVLEPVLEKARKAIKEVADENGYTYVFDSSIGVLLHYPEGDDILPLVKAKLGL